MKERFLRACRCEPVDCTPIWLMRQAGRYMEAYRRLRERYTMAQLVKTPELAVEITLQPIRAFDLDAAIIYSDILPPLEAMGLEVEFIDGEGPIVRKPLRSRGDVEALREPDPRENLHFVLQAIQLARQELTDHVPLIGFAGAPFTLATYAIEGGSARNPIQTKTLMYQEPQTWHLLMERLARFIGHYLRAQVAAGAQALQLFDSWVGALSPSDYEHYVAPYSRYVIQTAQATGVPVIHFSTGTGGMIEQVAATGGDVIAVDWRIPLDEAWQRIGYHRAIQGNLDPAVLLGPPEELTRQTIDILKRVGNRPGHIFNLGHGVLPQTSTEAVAHLVEIVHRETRR
ncbi:MAG: uroporphyrinogen decarboxylase [Anaerolineae bacterium]